MSEDDKRIEELESRIWRTLDVARNHGQVDGCCRKAWVIDQMIRILCGNREDYDAWVESYEDEFENDWDAGVGP